MGYICRLMEVRMSNVLTLRLLFLGLVSRNTKGCTTRSEKTEVYMKALVDMVAIAAQATGFIVWPFLEAGQRPNLWLIPVSLFCISCGWWENYVAKNSVIGETLFQYV